MGIKSKNIQLVVIVGLVMFGNIKCLAQIGESNPSQYVAIETGNIMIDKSIGKQSTAMEKTSLNQGAIGGEMLQMKGWQAKYNSYLKTAQGYAEALKAGCNLYAEGVAMLRNFYDIQKATAANPQGIAATLPMNNLYMEAASVCVNTYFSLKKSIAQGGGLNMMTGAERTALLWKLNNGLDDLNRKLRQIALSICFYNLMDVWNKATAGMISLNRGKIANDAFDRWKRARNATLILSSK